MTNAESAAIVLARFSAADHQFATEKLFVVQNFNCALCFFDRLHLDEGEAFGALVVAIAHYFGVLNVTDPVEKIEKIAFGRVERQIPDVKPGRSDFDRFRFTRRPRLLLRLLLPFGAIARLSRWFAFPAVACEKCGDPLPE
jgi:hypothetical protein